MLNGPEKIIRRIVFHFSKKFKMADESHVTLQSLNCFSDLFQGSNLSWNVDYIRIGVILTSYFCVVYIQKLVTVLYLSIINVFWLLNLFGAGGDASFAPQANLVLFRTITYVLTTTWVLNTTIQWYTIVFIVSKSYTYLLDLSWEFGSVVWYLPVFAFSVGSSSGRELMLPDAKPRGLNGGRSLILRLSSITYMKILQKISAWLWTVGVIAIPMIINPLRPDGRNIIFKFNMYFNLSNFWFDKLSFAITLGTLLQKCCIFTL